MHIVADENIPALDEHFGPFGTISTVAGRHLTAEQVADADILLVRSVTRVDRSLLEGSAVRFVGTCTIGTDHLDVDYLASRGIAYASAPGSNAGGVVQYVLAALAHCRGDRWEKLRVGVVGCGNVGGRVLRTLTALGADCVGYDPFVDVTTSDLPLGSLEKALARDVVSVHTPLTQAGPHPTLHMIDAAALARLPAGALLLNAGRGGAVDNRALLSHLEGGGDLQVVLDVWEHEPDINRALAEHVALATPHIAGYSVEGRLNGSAMICDALARLLGWSERQIVDHFRAIDASRAERGTLNVSSLGQAMLATYPIERDHRALLAAVTASKPLGPAFDALRKHYPQRHEPTYYQVSAVGDEVLDEQLRTAGFHVLEDR